MELDTGLILQVVAGLFIFEFLREAAHVLGIVLGTVLKRLSNKPRHSSIPVR